MNLSEEQLAALYKNVMVKLRARIIKKSGSIANFSKETGINRTSLQKQFSDSVEQEMSIGFYFRLLIVLGIIEDGAVSKYVLESNFRLLEYLSINNNTVMHTLAIVANDL
jgi:hypothetical protein